MSLALTIGAGGMYLRSTISTHGEAKRNLEFIEGDQDRQLKQQLWAETKIGDILPMGGR
jgi:hypothetical protein